MYLLQVARGHEISKYVFSNYLFEFKRIRINNCEISLTRPT
jgi:hypothetical protein